MKRIIHIAPALPPVVNGLGDFCKILSDNLGREGFDDHVFMVSSKNMTADSPKVVGFDKTNLSSLLKAESNAGFLFIHYAGYGYEKRGLPFYLASAVDEFKKASGCRVLIFFHELYSSSASVFQLPFYTSWLQKQIIRKLCKVADVTFTNCNIYKDLLMKVVNGHSIQNECTGIFSNVPDDLYDEKIIKKADSLIVFGSCHKRKAVYENPSFRFVVDKLKIKTIYDVGPGNALPVIDFRNVIKKGVLSVSKLAAVLNKAKYGAISYAPNLMGKSGIFAAYTAFGIIPINLIESDEVLNDGLMERKNYFTHRIDADDDRLHDGSIRNEVRLWYESRSQQAITAKIKQHLK